MLEKISVLNAHLSVAFLPLSHFLLGFKVTCLFAGIFSEMQLWLKHDCKDNEMSAGQKEE